MEGQGTCVGVSCYRKFTKKITRTKILQKMIVRVWPENDATALAPKLLIASRQAGESAWRKRLLHTKRVQIRMRLWSGALLFGIDATLN
jgi:hypothetical protein